MTEIPPLDLKPVQQEIVKGISNIRFLLLSQPQKTVYDQLPDLMESDAEKWAAYLIMVLTFLTYLYLFATTLGQQPVAV